MPDRLIDVLLGSKEVKRLLVERSMRYQLPFRDICQKIGVDYMLFMSTYVNSSGGKEEVINESQFLELMKELGINVRYQFVVDKNFDDKINKEKLLNSEF